MIGSVEKTIAKFFFYLKVHDEELQAQFLSQFLDISTCDSSKCDGRY